MMVCDQTSRKSFEDVKRHWLPEIINNADADAIKVLLLNKMDLPGKDLDGEEVEKFAQKEEVLLYETSAKTGKNVNGVFVELCRKLIAKSNDVQKKRTRNITTEKSLFKSSAYTYDEQEIKLNDGRNGFQETEQKKCCAAL